MFGNGIKTQNLYHAPNEIINVVEVWELRLCLGNVTKCIARA
jgi:hypothetical protein